MTEKKCDENAVARSGELVQLKFLKESLRDLYVVS